MLRSDYFSNMLNATTTQTETETMKEQKLYRVYFADTLSFITVVYAANATDAKRQARKSIKRGYKGSELFVEITTMEIN